MKSSGCTCHTNCVIITVILSIIAAITETVLFIIGYFPGVETTLLIALSLAFLLLLAFILSIISLSHNRRIELCPGSRSLVKTFVIGIIGTIASTSLALATFLTNAANSTITLVGVSAFAFSLMIISFVAISFILIDNGLFKRIGD